MYARLTTAGGKEVGEIFVNGSDIVEVTLTLFSDNFVLTSMDHAASEDINIDHTVLQLNGHLKAVS